VCVSVCVCFLSSVLTELRSRPFRLILGCHSDGGMDCVAGRRMELPDMCSSHGQPHGFVMHALPATRLL
jgi:hypothetical protein